MTSMKIFKTECRQALINEIASYEMQIATLSGNYLIYSEKYSSLPEYCNAKGG